MQNLRSMKLEQIDQWKREGKKLVFTNGCFDLLHPGHIHYLEEAAALGDKLIVGLNADNSVRNLKGPNRPINNEDFRKRMLEGLASGKSGYCIFRSNPIGPNRNNSTRYFG